MPRSTNGVCDKGRTRLDFADRSPSCLVGKSGQSAGNVESTPIGLVRDGERLDGYLPQELVGDPCKFPTRRKVCDEVC